VGTFQAAVVFVDISGFTLLTENLMKHGSEGAEILSDIRNAQDFAEKTFAEFETSLTLCRQLNFKKGVAKALLEIGEAQKNLNKNHQALTAISQACEEADKINNQLIKGYTLSAKCVLFKKYGKQELIPDLLQVLMPIAEKSGNEPLKNKWINLREIKIGRLKN
jgi:uncharacterized protein with HEPN domain